MTCGMARFYRLRTSIHRYSKHSVRQSSWRPFATKCSTAGVTTRTEKKQIRWSSKDTYRYWFNVFRLIFRKSWGRTIQDTCWVFPVGGTEIPILMSSCWGGNVLEVWFSLVRVWLCFQHNIWKQSTTFLFWCCPKTCVMCICCFGEGNVSVYYVVNYLYTRPIENNLGHCRRTKRVKIEDDMAYWWYSVCHHAQRKTYWKLTSYVCQIIPALNLTMWKNTYLFSIKAL